MSEMLEAAEGKVQYWHNYEEFIIDFLGTSSDDGFDKGSYLKQLFYFNFLGDFLGMTGGGTPEESKAHYLNTLQGDTPTPKMPDKTLAPKTVTESDEALETEEFKKDITGMNLANPNYFSQRMENRDPKFRRPKFFLEK